MKTEESASTPISKGGYKYQHSDQQDRIDFDGMTWGQLVALEQERGLDMSGHPGYFLDSPPREEDRPHGV